MNAKQSKDFSKKLLTLVLPIAFQQFMLALVSASDALMLGKLSQDSLSAVSLASQVTFVENLFFAAMTIGLSTLAVYFIVNLDEIVKLPAVYRHYKKYKWVKDLTVKTEV